MSALFRLMRALWYFGPIMFSYLWAIWRQKLMGRERFAKRWDKIHQRNAKRLYKGCIKLRGVFIKMGQVLSIMGTFLPKAYSAELEKLQDQVPPRPWRKMRKAMMKANALGDDPEQVFAAFDTEPVAAASLGQVYQATTQDGVHVAVKALYPDVRTIIAIDLRVIRMAMWVHQRFVKIGQAGRFLDQLTDMLKRETDLAQEAVCIKRMAKNFEDDEDVLFPEVIDALSSETVLTMTFMDGVKISKAEQLIDMGLEPNDVATKLVQMFFRQMFSDRFFHADPHPGNFFVQRGPEGQVRIVVLDLGSASEIRDNLVRGMLQVMTGFMTRNDDTLIAGIEEMGFVSASGDRALLERTIKTYFQLLLDLELNDFSNIDLQGEEVKKLADAGPKKDELRELMRAVEYPLGWFYVERAALLLFGLSAQLAPTLNTVQIGFPYIMKFLAENPLPTVQKTEGATPTPPEATP